MIFCIDFSSQMKQPTKEAAELMDLMPQLFKSANDFAEVLEIDGVSKLTGYSKNTVYQYVDDNKIPFYKPECGDRKLISPRLEIERWLKGHNLEHTDEYCKRKEQELLKQHMGGLN